MKYLISFLVGTSPALAHHADHAHMHGAESWLISAAIIILLALAILVRKRLQ
jgi:uncharacterized membrane protein